MSRHATPFQRALRVFVGSDQTAAQAAATLSERLGQRIPVATLNNWLQGRNVPGRTMRNAIMAAIDPE